MACALLATTASAVEPGDRPDARLATSSGEAVRLSGQRGKPVVLFYEDRDTTEQNAPLKKALFALGEARHLLDAVKVVAVANLEAWSWWPARGFALAAVRDEEAKAGIPVYVDLEGTLSRPPWNLPKKASSVLVLDETGKVLFVASGPLTGAERARVLALLESLLSRSDAHGRAAPKAAPGG